METRDKRDSRSPYPTIRGSLDPAPPGPHIPTFCAQTKGLPAFWETRPSGRPRPEAASLAPEPGLALQKHVLVTIKFEGGRNSLSATWASPGGGRPGRGKGTVRAERSMHACMPPERLRNGLPPFPPPLPLPTPPRPLKCHLGGLGDFSSEAPVKTATHPSIRKRAERQDQLGGPGPEPDKLVDQVAPSCPNQSSRQVTRGGLVDPDRGQRRGRVWRLPSPHRVTPTDLYTPACRARSPVSRWAAPAGRRPDPHPGAQRREGLKSAAAASCAPHFLSDLPTIGRRCAQRPGVGARRKRTTDTRVEG